LVALATALVLTTVAVVIEVVLLVGSCRLAVTAYLALVTIGVMSACKFHTIQISTHVQIK
jgi:hypothetical protein